MGRFGKLHVRYSKGSNGSGPRTRFVPLINGADRLLRWYVEEVRGLFDDAEHWDRPGAPLFPSERRGPEGSAHRVCSVTLRDGIHEAVGRHLPSWRGAITPHVLRHYCASQLYLAGMDLIAVQELLGHRWVATTMGYVHVHSQHVDNAWEAAERRAAARSGVTWSVRWNLRLTAANKGIWKASEMQRLLAERGLVISAGKMSGLWSGEPVSIRLDDLQVICAVLDCGPEELLISEPDTVPSARPTDDAAPDRRASGGTSGATNVAGPQRLRPRRGGNGRSLPPL